MFDATSISFYNSMALFVAMVTIPMCYWFPSSMIWDTKRAILTIKESGYVKYLPDAEAELVGHRRLRLVMMSIQLIGFAGLFLWINFYL
jgi:hypothetical protein